jgi:hypothetical protein
LAEAAGVGDRFDFDDLPVRYCEAENHEEPSAWNYDHADFAVDEGWLRCTGSALCSAAGYVGCGADLAWRPEVRRRDRSGVPRLTLGPDRWRCYDLVEARCCGRR